MIYYNSPRDKHALLEEMERYDYQKTKTFSSCSQSVYPSMQVEYVGQTRGRKDEKTSISIQKTRELPDDATSAPVTSPSIPSRKTVKL